MKLYYWRFLITGLLASVLSVANAEVIYLGIGNDEFANDVNVAQQKLSAAFSVAQMKMFQQDQGIVTALQQKKNMLRNGDIFIFHYSGHGGRQADGAEADGMRGIIGTSPDQGATFPNNPATDDQIAAIINMIPASVAVLSIFDSCFAGEMIDGAGDITRGAVVGTSGATCIAPISSIFLPLWNMALMRNQMGFLGGDANMDQMLTFGELFGALSGIMGASMPYAVNFDAVNAPQHLAYKFVPEPATFWLLLLPAALWAVGRRRTQS